MQDVLHILQSSLRFLKILFRKSKQTTTIEITTPFSVTNYFTQLRAGNDIAALFPKYLTVRKGFFICAVVSFAINPWYLLGSASVFISFLASYQIFLSSITGVLLCHYYIISRGYLEVPDLYTSNPKGVYHYIFGWNWRAYVAYVVGLVPNFYGFLDNMGVGINSPTGVTRAYYCESDFHLITDGFKQPSQNHLCSLFLPYQLCPSCPLFFAIKSFFSMN